MSLAVRVIPCLDVDPGRVVKGANFRDLRDAGDPVELARRYDAEGADELFFLDITRHARPRHHPDVVRRTAEEIFIPLTVGGGVRIDRRHRPAARAGSDKVIQQLLQAFGGPGRRALGFDPGYSMHSLIARVTCTGWVSAARDEDFGLDPERAAARDHANPAGPRLPDLAEQPDRHRRADGLIEAVCAAAPAWW